MLRNVGKQFREYVGSVLKKKRKATCKGVVHSESKKQDTKFLPITSPNVN